MANVHLGKGGVMKGVRANFLDPPPPTKRNPMTEALAQPLTGPARGVLGGGGGNIYEPK